MFYENENAIKTLRLYVYLLRNSERRIYINKNTIRYLLYRLFEQHTGFNTESAEHYVTKQIHTAASRVTQVVHLISMYVHWGLNS